MEFVIRCTCVWITAQVLTKCITTWGKLSHQLELFFSSFVKWGHYIVQLRFIYPWLKLRSIFLTVFFTIWFQVRVGQKRNLLQIRKVKQKAIFSKDGHEQTWWWVSVETGGFGLPCLSFIPHLTHFASCWLWWPIAACPAVSCFAMDSQKQ